MLSPSVTAEVGGQAVLAATGRGRLQDVRGGPGAPLGEPGCFEGGRSAGTQQLKLTKGDTRRQSSWGGVKGPRREGKVGRAGGRWGGRGPRVSTLEGAEVSASTSA